MGEPVPLGRACDLCGEQVILHVDTEWSDYTDDLAGLLNASPGERVLVEAECGCSTPRKVSLEGATFNPEAVVSDY
jgi:hypothetical protein